MCAIGSSPDKLEAEISFPTTTPQETIGRTIAFFQEYQQREMLSAIGVGSFGPLDLTPASPKFGYITATPKLGWANTDIYGRINRALGVPVGFDTDVNAAALGEATWGAAKGLETFVYLLARASAEGEWPTVNCCMGFFIQRWDTYGCRMTWTRIPTRERVPSTAIASKAWRLGQRCLDDGEVLLRNCRRIIRRGDWRRIILRWGW